MGGVGEGSSGLKWRLMLGAGLIPPLVQAVLLVGLPESPRWCIQRGHLELAQRNRETLAILAGTADSEDSDIEEGDSEPTPLSITLACVAIGLSVMQQLSGVNAVIFYAPTMYNQLGVS